VFTDTQIQGTVKAALDGDVRIAHPPLIAVSVDEIGTVVLSGAVGTLPGRSLRRMLRETSRVS
jgi:hypothetical protein